MGVYLHDGGDSPEDDDAVRPYQIEVLNNELDNIVADNYDLRETVKECIEVINQMAQYIANKEGKGVGLMFDLPTLKKVKQ